MTSVGISACSTKEYFLCRTSKVVNWSHNTNPCVFVFSAHSTSRGCPFPFDVNGIAQTKLVILFSVFTLTTSHGLTPFCSLFKSGLGSLDAKMMSPRPNGFGKCCKAISPFMKNFVLIMPSDGSHDYFSIRFFAHCSAFVYKFSIYIIVKWMFSINPCQ